MSVYKLYLFVMVHKFLNGAQFIKWVSVHVYVINALVKLGPVFYRRTDKVRI